MFCTKGSGRYGSDKKSVTDKRTHGRTDVRTGRRTYTEGKTIYVSRRGRHIILLNIIEADSTPRKKTYIIFGKFQFLCVVMLKSRKKYKPSKQCMRNIIYIYGVYKTSKSLDRSDPFVTNPLDIFESKIACYHTNNGVLVRPHI